MKLKYQLNLFAALILTAVSILTAVIGVLAIDQVTRELNSRLLTHEVHGLMNDIEGTKQILNENRVDTIETYVARAQRDLLDEFRQFKFGETGQLLVIDMVRNNNLIQGGQSRLLLQKDCIDTIISRQEGVEFCSGGSKKYLISFATDEDWQWVVAVSVDEAEIVAARNRFLWSVVCILVISLGLGIILFFWLSGKIIHPIKQLTAAADSVSQGNWDAPIPQLSGDNEIAQLANIFKKMSGNLSESYKKLQDNLNDIAKSREQLRLSREQFRGLVETSSDLVWEVDADGRYTYVSPRVEVMLGYRIDELLGRQADQFTADDSVEPAFGYGELLLTNMPFSTVERKVRTLDGNVKILESSGRPFFDADGKRLGFRGIDRDITERKLAVEMQQELQDQLNQAQKMESIGRLAGGVAHDYNNMLSVIIGNVDLALEDPALPPSASVYFNEIQKAAERSARITKQLLAFARKQTVCPQQLDLNTVIGELLTMLRRLIGEDVALFWQPGDEVWPIELDSSQLDQIMVNLCVNSRDAIDNNGSITIRTKNVDLDETFCMQHNRITPGPFVMLQVEDNGKGMEKELLEHIFEPFFTTKEMGKGTGLGLATVYGIIRQNGGVIDVTSTLGEGSVFTMYFPAHEQDKREEEKDGRKAPPLSGKGTILLVEDETQVLRMTSRILSAMGYDVLEAQTPAEALRLSDSRGSEIDLLITDVVMPEMIGHDLMKAVCSGNPHIQCLFISGYPADVISHHGILEPGVFFLQKPFTRDGLAVKISEILNRHPER